MSEKLDAADMYWGLDIFKQDLNKIRLIMIYDSYMQ